MRCSLLHRRREDSPQSLAPLFSLCCTACVPDAQVYRLVCSLCKTAPLDKACTCIACGRQLRFETSFFANSRFFWLLSLLFA